MTLDDFLNTRKNANIKGKVREAEQVKNKNIEVLTDTKVH